MTILIDDALVLTPKGFLSGSVFIDGARIAAISHGDADRADLRARARDIVQAEGCWLIPGLIDAHAHAYASLLRGTENSLPLELWALHTTLYGRAFDDAAISAAIMLGAAERIRAGITGLIDHTPMVHLAQSALAAHERSGLRVGYAAFLQDISDYTLLHTPLPPDLVPLIGGPPQLDAPAVATSFAEMHHTTRAGSGRVTLQLGPNAPQRCSLAAWTLWRQLRDRHDLRVHVHLMETHLQQHIGQRDYRDGLIATMHGQGLLDGGITAAHGIYLSDTERATLAATGATIVHNPASNLMLGSGILPMQRTRDLGLNVALGTDSSNTGGRHDLFETMRLAMMLPRVAARDVSTWPTAAEILQMTNEKAAPVLGLAGQLGRIVPGQLADLALVRHDRAATLSMLANESALVQFASPDAVDSVMVNGAWVMRGQKILAFDEEAVIQNARSASETIREKVNVGLVKVERAISDIAKQLSRI
jgi:5-methylthioadenosine/S-adenosylhomocysteine deaminase